MLLAIDVGNTNTVLGVFRDSELVRSWRLSSSSDRTVDEYVILLGGLLPTAGLTVESITGVALSSVVPPTIPFLVQMCEIYLHMKPLVVGPGVKTGMAILYDNPREVGADRIVNAVAAHARFQSALIVVDFGTATTFDCVSARAEYLGGVIAPGIYISSEALFHRTAQLPNIDISRPPRVMGRNTASSIQSGIYYGYLSLVDGIIARLREEMGGSPRVVATGGLAELFSRDSTEIGEVVPHLTLEGLRIIWERNQPPSHDAVRAQE